MTYVQALVALAIGICVHGQTLPAPNGDYYTSSNVDTLRSKANNFCFYFEDPRDGRFAQIIQFFPTPFETIISPKIEVCIDGMVWRHAVCRCLPPGASFAPGQESSTLSNPKCNYVANIKYYGDKKAYLVEHYITNGTSEARADLAALTVSGVTGSKTGAALRLSGQILGLQSFAGNDLQGTWRSKLRIRPEGSSLSKMVVLSNECDLEAKSVEVALTGTTLTINLRLVNDTDVISCQVKAATDGWYDIQAESVKNDLIIKVNDNICGRSNKGSTIAKSECRLYLGGNPRSPADAFNGYVENFEFLKNYPECP